MGLVAPPSHAISARTYRWEAYRPIVRVFDSRLLPNSFNPAGTTGRFRPVEASPGSHVPTLYGSNRLDGALGETLFHDVPAGIAAWVVPRTALLGKLRTLLIPRKSLALVDLTGWAHKALHVDGRQLVECDPIEYPTTALWAQRFHDLGVSPDGLYWRSRQYDKAHALMLFGDRVSPGDLHVVLDETIPLWEGLGLDEVVQAARDANVTITIP